MTKTPTKASSASTWCRACAQNLQSLKISKDFMLSHGYIKNDFDVDEWAAPQFLEKAAVEVLEEEWKTRAWPSCPKELNSKMR